MNPWDSLLNDGLQQPVTAIAYGVSRHLAVLFPDKALIEGDACPFDLEEFIRDEHCTVRDRSCTVHNQITTDWHGVERGLGHTFQNLWFEVSWQEHTLDVLLMQWPSGFQNESRYWILAEAKTVAESFFSAV